MLKLLSLSQTWGIIVARAFTGPVWYFIADWFMLFLPQEKHFEPKNTLVAYWIPFIAADLGNFTGGGGSSWLVHRGWSVEKAGKAVIVVGAFGMTILIPAIYATNLFAVARLFAIATFCYCLYCAMALVLPSDLYKSESVASVSGMSGGSAAFVTIVSTYLIGDVADKYGFQPIPIAGSIIPIIGMFLILWLIHDPKTEEDKKIMRRIS